MSSTYTVTGMTCGHCAAFVTEEVAAIAGDEDVTVALGTGLVTITRGAPVDPVVVRAAVEEAGCQLG